MIFFLYKDYEFISSVKAIVISILSTEIVHKFENMTMFTYKIKYEGPGE